MSQESNQPFEVTGLFYQGHEDDRALLPVIGIVLVTPSQTAAPRLCYQVIRKNGAVDYIATMSTQGGLVTANKIRVK